MAWIDCLAIGLLILLAAGVKPMRGAGSINEDYLSVSTGNTLRGLFALVVMFHHLAQDTQAGWLFPFFELVGHLAVAVFFFLSGYGLQKSYIASEQYRNAFLRRRLSKVLLPYVVVTGLYWLASVCAGNGYTLQHIFLAALQGWPIVDFSWYVISICWFYLAFWLFMGICKENYNRMLVCAGIWFGVYFIACRCLDYGQWWYNTPQLLIVGMFWAIHEKKILSRITSHYALAAPVSIGVYGLICILKELGLAGLPMTMLEAVAFVMAVLVVLLKVKLESRVFSFLGRISLEIYLLHGLWMGALRSELVYIQDESLWSLAVVAGCIASALVLHKVMAVILNRVSRPAKKAVNP